MIFCRFRAMTLSTLHLVVNWPVFTICIGKTEKTWLKIDELELI